MSDLVPEGWSYDQLGDYISESVAGEWGIEATGDANDIPVLRSTNFTASGIIDYSKLAYRNIDERKRLAKSLKFGDIVLEKSGGSPTQPVGRVVYFDKYKPFLFSNFTQKLSPVDTCDSKFLFYKLYSEYQNGTVLKFQQQTTGIINFQLAEYLGYKSAFPPLPEQQKIATILSSVDNVIEKTRAQIDKLKDLKTGMMQELLTKGIGHTEFKDSPLGRIPVAWNVLSLQEVITLTSGKAKTKKDLSVQSKETPFPVYGGNGINGYCAEYLLDERVVVIGRVGEYCGVVHLTSKFSWITDNALYVKQLSLGFDLKFVFYQMTHASLGKLRSKGGQPLISQEPIYKLELAFPPLAEQIKIASILQSVDKRIEKVSLKLSNLVNTKKALMQDLLTGKVRVNLTDKESAVV